MSNPICQEHGLEAIIKPAGVSKSTGRPYNAFYSCPGKEPDGGYCQFKFTERPPVAGFGVARANQAAATGDKDKSIRWMNSLKIASELIAAGTIPVGPDWKVTLEETAKYVNTLPVPNEASSVPF